MNAAITGQGRVSKIGADLGETRFHSVCKHGHC